MTIIFIAIIFSVLFIGALFNPITGVLGYLSIYLLYNPYLWWCQPIAEILKRPSLVASVFLVAGCILHRDKLNWQITRRECEFYIFLALIWFVSLVIGYEVHSDTWFVLDKMTKTFVFIFLLLRVVHTEKNLNILLWGFILGAVFLAYQAHVIGYFYNGRLEDIGGIDFRESNAFALFMGISVVLLGFKMIRLPLRLSILTVPFLALMVNTIVLTRSRAGFVGLLAVVPYVVYTMPKLYRKKIYISLLFGVILLILLADSQFIDRMKTIINPFDGGVRIAEQIDVEENHLSRIDFWKMSIDIFKDYPLGIGARNFQRIAPLYDSRNPGMDAHNTYILCYTEIGAAGFIVFIIIILSGLNQLIRAQKIARNVLEDINLELYGTAIFSVLLVYLIGGMTTHSYLYHEILWIIFSLPICYENAVNRLCKEKINGASPLPLSVDLKE